MKAAIMMGDVPHRIVDKFKQFLGHQHEMTQNI